MAIEVVEDDHAAAATGAWRPMLRYSAGGAVIVVLCWCLPRRHRCGDQFPGTRNAGLAGGGGEQPVVADAMEPLGEDGGQGAADELVRGARRGAVPRPSLAAGGPREARDAAVTQGAEAPGSAGGEAAVEHGGGADAGAEVPGIGSDREQRLGRRAEQQAIDHRLVLIGDWSNLGGQRED